jgi:hypothetical protein
METIGSEPLDFGEGARGRVDERSHVHALALRHERRQVARPAREHVHGPMVVAFPEMVKRDADLKDPLIQATHVTPLGAPQELERLVLFEVLTAIELRDSFEEESRRSFVARWHGLC